MFAFLLEGALGTVLAPPSNESDRLLGFLERNQEEAALVQLQASQDNQPSMTTEGVHLDIEVCSNGGRRPIHIAVGKGFGAVLMELLRMKVDLEARDASQRTALLIGAASGRRVCVEMLLHAGADATARDENGMDAIALASVPALREYITEWSKKHRASRRKDGEAPPKPLVTLRASIPNGGTQVVTPPSQAVGSARPSALWTPVSGSRFTGPISETRPQVVADSIIRAAEETAETLISPTDHWKKRSDVFKAVQRMGGDDKQVCVCVWGFTHGFYLLHHFCPDMDKLCSTPHNSS